MFSRGGINNRSTVAVLVLQAVVNAAASLGQQSRCRCEVDLIHGWVLPALVLVLPREPGEGRVQLAAPGRLQERVAVPRHCPSVRTLRPPRFLGELAESYPIARGGLLSIIYLNYILVNKAEVFSVPGSASWLGSLALGELSRGAMQANARRGRSNGNKPQAI